MAEDYMKAAFEHVSNVDVRARREFSHTVTPEQREFSRVNWMVRNAENMKKMKARQVTPLYQR